MDRPSRLPVDCPRCENRGVLTLDDDRTIACPLCNSWCTLGYDWRGDAARGKAADRVHVPFFPRQA